MKRTEIRRTGFKRPAYAPPPAAPLKPLAQPPNYTGTTSGEPVTKDTPLQSEPYRRLVATLCCIRCGLAGYSNAAHPNSDKAKAMKADDRLCFALCVDRPLIVGCHSLFDTHKLFVRGERRDIEEVWAQKTQAMLIGLSAFNPRVARVLKDVGLL